MIYVSATEVFLTKDTIAYIVTMERSCPCKTCTQANRAFLLLDFCGDKTFCAIGRRSYRCVSFGYFPQL